MLLIQADMPIIPVVAESDGCQGPKTLREILRWLPNRPRAVVSVRNRALIRKGGEQGRAAVSCCFSPGITAHGLSWENSHV